MSEVKSFFDIINNINSSHELLTREQVESCGNLFMTNKGMCNNADTIFFADEANEFKHADLYSQYLFYFYSVNKKKRYGKWEKKDSKVEHLDLIKSVYDVNDNKALDILDILSDNQIKTLVELSAKGGKIGNQTKAKKQAVK